MAYDLAAMRGHFRFLIADPSGRAISNTDLRDLYLNPTYQDWFRRFERRPAVIGTAGTAGAGLKTNIVATIGSTSGIIEHVTIIGPPEAGLIRDEFNRIRYLQETEGGIGTPEIWGFEASYTAGSDLFDVVLAFYPIPDVDVFVNVYFHITLTLLSGDANTTVLDPTSARYVTRLAAFRAGTDLGLPTQRLKAIVRPLPEWVKAEFRMNWLFEEKPLPEEQSLGFRKEEVRA